MKSVHGMQVVFTGKFRLFSEQDAKSRATALGAIVRRYLTNSVDLLVAGEDADAQIKIAKSHSIRVIDEQEWIRLTQTEETVEAEVPSAPFHSSAKGLSQGAAKQRAAIGFDSASNDARSPTSAEAMRWMLEVAFADNPPGPVARAILVEQSKLLGLDAATFRRLLGSGEQSDCSDGSRGLCLAFGYCARCSCLGEPGRFACDSCGSPLPPAVCPVCDAPRRFGSEYCSSCGIRPDPWSSMLQCAMAQDAQERSTALEQQFARLLVSPCPINDRWTVDVSPRIELRGAIGVSSRAAEVALWVLRITGRLNKCSEVDLGPYGCESLKDLQVFSDHPGIEAADLRGCKNLCDASGLQHMSSLKRLSISGPGCPSTLKSLGRTRAGVTSLTLTGCDSIADLECLDGFAALQRLEFTGCGAIAALQGLESLPSLSSLRIERCQSLGSLTGNRGLHSLASLHIENCGLLRELAGIEGFSSLDTLCISHCGSLKSLEAIRGHPSLRALHIRECSALVSLDGLSGLRNLVSLRVDKCRGLKSVEGMSGLESLAELHIVDCDALESLCGLSDLGKVAMLDLSGASQLLDLRAVSAMPNVEQLNLDRCTKLQDLSPIAGLPHLTRLSIYSTPSIPNKTRAWLTVDLQDGLKKLRRGNRDTMPLVAAVEQLAEEVQDQLSAMFGFVLGPEGVPSQEWQNCQTRLGRLRGMCMRLERGNHDGQTGLITAVDDPALARCRAIIVKTNHLLERASVARIVRSLSDRIRSRVSQPMVLLHEVLDRRSPGTRSGSVHAQESASVREVDSRLLSSAQRRGLLGMQSNYRQDSRRSDGESSSPFAVATGFLGAVRGVFDSMMQDAPSTLPADDSEREIIRLGWCSFLLPLMLGGDQVPQESTISQDVLLSATKMLFGAGGSTRLDATSLADVVEIERQMGINPSLPRIDVPRLAANTGSGPDCSTLTQATRECVASYGALRKIASDLSELWFQIEASQDEGGHSGAHNSPPDSSGPDFLGGMVKSLFGRRWPGG